MWLTYAGNLELSFLELSFLMSTSLKTQTNRSFEFRCLHNFNGVLQICSAFTNSSVFRLKRTWEKLTKSVSFYEKTTENFQKEILQVNPFK